jgi:hypothetical protein
MNFYSYLYRDPSTNTPRYAGKGSGNRAYIHTKNRCDNKALKGWIKNLKEQNLQPIIEIIPAMDEEHACFIEECFIKIFGRLDLGTGTLFNHTNGGEGIAGYRHTKETKEKIRKSSIGRSYPISEEHKEKLRIFNIGKKLTKETKEKMSAARLGKPKPWNSSIRLRTEKELSVLQKMTEKVKLKVEIFGIVYQSIREAAKAIDVHEETTRHRCHSKNFPDYKIIGKQKCRE